MEKWQHKEEIQYKWHRILWWCLFFISIEILKLMIKWLFSLLCNMSIRLAQSVEREALCLEVVGSNPMLGPYFCLCFSFLFYKLKNWSQNTKCTQFNTLLWNFTHLLENVTKPTSRSTILLVNIMYKWHNHQTVWFLKIVENKRIKIPSFQTEI